jgi:hypothetical protein
MYASPFLSFSCHCLILLSLILDKTIAQIQVVQKDLQQQLDDIWDDLPIDTVIASMLDPRTKWFKRIPVNEIGEALKLMKKVQGNFLIYLSIYLTN